MKTRIIRTIWTTDAHGREVAVHEMERFETAARTLESPGGNWVGSWLATGDGEGVSSLGETTFRTNSGRVLQAKP